MFSISKVVPKVSYNLLLTRYQKNMYALTRRLQSMTATYDKVYEELKIKDKHHLIVNFPKELINRRSLNKKSEKMET